MPAVQPAGDQTQATLHDQQNRLHRLWVDQTAADQFRLLYQVQSLSGTPLAPATLVHESASRIRRPHLAIDDAGTLHLLWQERFAKGAGAKSREGTWVHYAQLASSDSGASLLRHEVLNQRPLAQHPDLSVDSRGVAYAIWEEDQNRLVLAKVSGPKQPVDYRWIAADFGKGGHGFPALTVDRRGDLHLAWSTVTSIGTQQIVYATLLHGAFDTARITTQPVYTTTRSADRPKQLRVAEQTGSVTIHWKNQRERGPLGRLVASTGSVIFTLKHGAIIDRVTILDTMLTPSPTPRRSAMPLAVTAKAPPIEPAVIVAALLTPPWHIDVSTSARSDDSIGKLKLARLLAFSRWSSAPPPHTREVTASSTRLLAIPALPHQSSLQSVPLDHFVKAAFFVTQKDHRQVT
jgi:hypothetical protein